MNNARKIGLTCVLVSMIIVLLLMVGCDDQQSGNGGSSGKNHRQHYDLKVAAEKLGVSENVLTAVMQEAIKSKPPDLAGAAVSLNVSKDALVNALQSSQKQIDGVSGSSSRGGRRHHSSDN